MIAAIHIEPKAAAQTSTMAATDAGNSSTPGGSFLDSMLAATHAANAQKPDVSSDKPAQHGKQSDSDRSDEKPAHVQDPIGIIGLPVPVVPMPEPVPAPSLPVAVSSASLNLAFGSQPASATTSLSQTSSVVDTMPQATTSFPGYAAFSSGGNALALQGFGSLLNTHSNAPMQAPAPSSSDNVADVQQTTKSDEEAPTPQAAASATNVAAAPQTQQAVQSSLDAELAALFPHQSAPEQQADAARSTEQSTAQEVNTTTSGSTVPTGKANAQQANRPAQLGQNALNSTLAAMTTNQDAKASQTDAGSSQASIKQDAAVTPAVPNTTRKTPSPFEAAASESVNFHVPFVHANQSDVPKNVNVANDHVDAGAGSVSLHAPVHPAGQTNSSNSDSDSQSQTSADDQGQSQVTPTAHAVPGNQIGFSVDHAAVAGAQSAHMPVPASSPLEGSTPAVHSDRQSAGVTDNIAPQTTHAQPLVNTARLVQSVNETGMRVGIRSEEFGNVSISTSATRQAVTAQISVEHTELAKTIAAGLPEMQARLGSDQPLQVRIATGAHEGHMDTNSGAAGGNQSNAQGDNQWRQSPAPNYFSTNRFSVDPQPIPAEVVRPVDIISNSRLSVRA